MKVRKNGSLYKLIAYLVKGGVATIFKDKLNIDTSLNLN